MHTAKAFIPAASVQSCSARAAPAVRVDLHRWRETFAEKLRGWGVEAEATRQATRGENRNFDPLWRVKARQEGRLRQACVAAKTGQRYWDSRADAMKGYLFAGREGSIRKQIGNAVPPLLGAALGKHLAGYAGEGDFIDLFAGAGGLSLGLELAGCRVAAAVEYDKSIGATYQVNRPCERVPAPDSGRTLFLLKDMSSSAEQDEVIRAIRAKVGKRAVGAVMGGPPCQGFSHAGWRSSGDARNNLTAAFLIGIRHAQPACACPTRNPSPPSRSACGTHNAFIGGDRACRS